jgi:hemerythrin-like domain-containing protein
MHEKLFDTLHEEHEKVKQVLRQIQQLGMRDSDRRDQLFMELKHLLLPHMKGEESVLYSALADRRETHDSALHAIEEHHAARLLLNELDEMRRDTEQWKAKLDVFYDVLMHHIESEEKVVFQKTEQNFSHEEMQDIHSGYRNIEERELSLL